MGNVLRSDLREDAVMTTTIKEPPKSPSVADTQSHTFKPEETNPELQAGALAKEMLAKFPTPAIVTKKFGVYQGILKAVNHTKDNPTYFDCSVLIAVFDETAATSVNVDGALFKNFWAYMMHPNYIIQGMPMQTAAAEEPGFISRVMARLTGKQPQENKTS